MLVTNRNDRMDIRKPRLERQSNDNAKRSSNVHISDGTTKPLSKVRRFFTRTQVLWQDPDPEEMSIDYAYKTRWIWYHTILGLELLIVNMLLIAILIVLAVKL